MAENLSQIIHRITTAWRENKVVSVLFLDVEGAFPNAVPAKLIYNLKKRCILTSIINFVKQLLNNRKTRLKFDDYISETITVTNGIGQGDPLSMILYIPYNSDLLEIPNNPQKKDGIGYVDDIALLAIAVNFTKTTKIIKDMMTRDKGSQEWSLTHNSRFEVIKSTISHFSRKTKQDPDSENKCIPIMRPLLILGNQMVQEVNCYKYLGIQIDSQLQWKEQTQRALANATKWLLQFQRLSKPSTGVNTKLIRQLYLAVALPKITYGINVWYTLPTKPLGCTKKTGSVGALHNLQKTQRIAALAITSTLRTTPTNFIDTHTGILPIKLALLKACHNTLIRLLTLPDHHALSQIVRMARCSQLNKHLSPINQLIKQFNIGNNTIETIYPTAYLNRINTKYKMVIDSSRKESIKSKANDKANFKIYSDRSSQGNGIGSAAILYKKGKTGQLMLLKAYLGTAAEHNTYEAKILGTIIALLLIKNTPETIGKNVSLYTDNQSIIEATSNPKSTSGQYLIDTLRKLANTVECNLYIQWISSHSKV